MRATRIHEGKREMKSIFCINKIILLFNSVHTVGVFVYVGVYMRVNVGFLWCTNMYTNLSLEGGNSIPFIFDFHHDVNVL